jgi:hypothetical protein
MVNCLNVKKYILSIVSEKLSVSVSQKVSDTKSISRDLSRLVSIPYILYFSNFANIFKLFLCLSPLVSCGYLPKISKIPLSTPLGKRCHNVYLDAGEVFKEERSINKYQTSFKTNKFSFSQNILTIQSGLVFYVWILSYVLCNTTARAKG